MVGIVIRGPVDCLAGRVLMQSTSTSFYMPLSGYNIEWLLGIKLEAKCDEKELDSRYHGLGCYQSDQVPPTLKSSMGLEFLSIALQRIIPPCDQYEAVRLLAVQ